MCCVSSSGYTTVKLRTMISTPGFHPITPLFCRLIDASYCIKAARIPDIRKALGYYPDQEILVISKIHISLCMGNKLRFTSALRKQKAESNHLPLP